jgi:flagellin-like hook-associated protein FlgL
MDVSASTLNILNNYRQELRDARTISQRLSSGMRINYGGDDPSGLGISKGMSASIRGALTAAENIADGLRMIATADSALNEIQDMLFRIRDLAIRASNEAVLRDDCRDRTRINMEAQSLIKEINRLSLTQFYNEKKILQGDPVVDVTSSNDQVVFTGAANTQYVVWSDMDTITFMDEITTSATRPGADPGGISRVFSQDIDLSTNTAIGAPTQETEDPFYLVDNDGDGYYDLGNTGVINDILNALGNSAPDAPDADGDGWVAAVDNDDTDATDTGTGLNTLAANYNIPVIGTATSQSAPAAITWDNAISRTLGAAMDIDSVNVTAPAGTSYYLQYFSGGAWSTFGTFVGSQTINTGGINASQVRVAADDPVSQNAGISINSVINNVTLNAPAAAATPDTERVNIIGAPQIVNNVDITVTAGVAYNVYWDNGGGNPVVVASSVGTGATQNLAFAGVNASSFWVDMAAPGAVAQFDAYNGAAPVAANAPVAEPRRVQASLATAGEALNRIQLNVTAGVAYDLYADGALLLSSTGTGAVQTHNAFGSVSPTNLYVLFRPGQGGVANVASINAFNDATLGAPSSSFVDVNSDNDNVATYTLNTGGGNVAEAFDLVQISVANAHPYTMYWSDNGVAWNLLGASTGTGGVQSFAPAADLTVDTSGNGDAYFRVVMNSGEDVGAAILAAPTFTNRIDRDGDGFPDVIEQAAGSSPTNAAAVPGWSLSGQPDMDNDGFLDHANYDRIYDNTYLATNNPFGGNWDGSGARLGNPLDAAGGQYPNPGDFVNPLQVPSTTDTDGDTIPDPLDPFINTAEWATWNDSEASFRGGYEFFISNRSTPDQPARRDVYLKTGPGAYQLVAAPGDAQNLMVSWDASKLAYESGGGIWGVTLTSTGCGGAATTFSAPYLISAAGSNPSWSPYSDQVVFDDGANLHIVDIASGLDTVLEAGINPDWSPDGDNIVYESGGAIRVYNIVAEKSFATGLTGTEPTWSNDGAKISFRNGNDVHVADINIIQEPHIIQAGGFNGESFRVDLPLPDSRAGSLGLIGLTLINDAAALSAIDTVDAAMEKVSTDRAQTGITYKRLEKTLNDIYTYRISIESARSRIQDADMAKEASDMARANIKLQGSTAMLAHNATNTEQAASRAIDDSLKYSLYKT